MEFTDSYSLLEQDRHHCAFAGMNTGGGFRGEYSRLIDESALRRLYIIKGSAGSGKSTLMKRCGKFAEEAGCSVKYYLCGSDADSVDCIVIDGRLAMLDGTSPHAHEMKYPGGVSRLVDTAAFFDCALLERAREEIIRLTDEKRSCFDSAYSFLSALSTVRGDMNVRSRRVVDHTKLEKFVDRIVRKMSLERREHERHELVLSSIGMKGKHRLDTLEARARRVLYIRDEYLTAFAATAAIAERLMRDGRAVTLVRDPVLPECLRGVFVEESTTYFTLDAPRGFVGDSTADERASVVNMSRFIDRAALENERAALRMAQKCACRLEREALFHLSAAGERHFALERIYSSAMDFEALDSLTLRLCRELSELLRTDPEYC